MPTPLIRRSRRRFRVSERPDCGSGGAWLWVSPTVPAYASGCPGRQDRRSARWKRHHRPGMSGRGCGETVDNRDPVPLKIRHARKIGREGKPGQDGEAHIEDVQGQEVSWQADQEPEQGDGLRWPEAKTWVPGRSGDRWWRRRACPETIALSGCRTFLKSSRCGGIGVPLVSDGQVLGIVVANHPIERLRREAEPILLAREWSVGEHRFVGKGLMAGVDRDLDHRCGIDEDRRLLAHRRRRACPRSPARPSGPARMYADENQTSARSANQEANWCAANETVDHLPDDHGTKISPTPHRPVGRHRAVAHCHHSPAPWP